MTSPARPPLVLRILGSLRRLWPLLLIGGLALAGWEELRRIDLNAVRAALHALSVPWLLLAAAITIANLALLGLYDVITLRGTSAPTMARWRLGSLAFAWSNFLTLGPIAGPAIRFWLYRPYGIEAAALRGAIVANVVAFGAGLGVFLLASIILSAKLVIPAAFVSLILLAILLGGIERGRRVPTWLRRGTASWAALFSVAFLDWLLAAAVFAAVLRATGKPFDLLVVARTFLAGQTLGAVSLLPGGLGSADTYWLLRLPIDAAAVGAALLAYRAIYYVAPWLFACVVLMARGARAGARWLNPVPTILGLLVGAAGAVMLVSTASPALEHRMRVLARFVPLGVVELSHLLGALLGVVLLFLARGVMRGYRQAHRLTVVLLVGGAVLAALKGLDYEEALVLLILAAVTASQAVQFQRAGRAPWVGWTAGGLILLAILIFSVVGLQSYAAAEYREGLIWTFGFGHALDLARFLRAFALLALGGTVFILYAGLRSPAPFHVPERAEIDRALALHEAHGAGTSALMVAAGDKSIFFHGEGSFCAYRVVGSYLVVFSDPTVVAGEERRFIEALLQYADGLDRRLIFYQIGAAWLPLLHDHGFSFFKLGEEAALPLEGFALAGARWKTFRHAVRRVEEQEGFGFAILPPEAVAGRLAELRGISDEWLESKEAREKQFSIGAFSAPYLTRFPCAVVRDAHGTLVAFANLLCGPGRGELSIDLMRHTRGAPEQIMDYLFVRLLEWGHAEGFRVFNFGMAPLAAVGEMSRAPIWERLARLLFRHGEGLYNFRGLRAYKAKFHPTWVPRYMAYPQSWEWPFAATQVTVLIAGGWRALMPAGRSGT